MKNLFLILIAITTTIFSAKAQENNSDKTQNSTEQKKVHRKHKGFDHQEMTERLGLTDEQKQQMKSINSDFKNRMQELKKSEGFSEQELNEKKQALATERMEKVQALLTPEQEIQMRQLKKEGKGRKEMSSVKRMEKMKSALNFSDEQVANIKAHSEEFRTKEEAIKNNESLTTDQKKEQLKSLREERKNSFKSFLTPEQTKKLDEMKHNRPVKTS